MVILNNTWIMITKDDPSYFPLSINLRFTEEGKRKVFKKLKSGKTKVMFVDYVNDDKLYKIDKGIMLIQIGLFKLLEPYFTKSEIVDKRFMTDLSFLFDNYLSKRNRNEYLNILDGIILRDEQLLAIFKMSMNRRCIIQLPTGFGKTEIMCAFLKLFDFEFGYYPTSLIIEPNIQLVTSTTERLINYGIPAEAYSENRVIKDNFITVCHPASLSNDLEKDNTILNNVSILIGDECHHMQSVLFSLPSKSCDKLEYCIGLSASAISQDNVMTKDVRSFSVNELKMISATGPLVMNVTTGYCIKKGYLAVPIVFAMDNPATEFIPDEEFSNWHKIVETKLYSDYRNQLVGNVANFFACNNRRVLILVSTIKWARMLLSIIHEINNEMSNDCRTSYGGNRSEMCDKDGEIVKDNTDVLSDFKNGEKYKILIGTSHLYEGADIKNLDVIILAYGGKKDRLFVQGIGRCLRKTKYGKYAYIIDFNDKEDVILNKQFKIRLNRYKTDMRIPDSFIYEDATMSILKQEFEKLEEQ